MYFDFRTYGKVAFLVITDKPGLKRLAAHILLLIGLGLWALVTALFMGIDHLFYPGFRKQKIHSPVFIVGNARSGTTLFHRLLSVDSGRFVNFKMWDILLPSVIQKKLVHMGAITIRKSFPSLYRKLTGWEEKRAGDIKRIRPFGLTKPEEDEFLFLMTFASPVITVLFPYMDRLADIQYFDNRSEKTRRRIMNHYRGCVQRHLYFHGGDRILLSKNPAFVSKMRALAEEFPDGKFVYLMRNPYETIPSLMSLLKSVWERLGIHRERMDRAVKQLVEGCVREYRYAHEVLDELPPHRYAVVEYRDLVNNAAEAVKRVYRCFDFGLSADFDGFLSMEKGRQSRHRSGHFYTLEDFNVPVDTISSRLNLIMSHYNYQPPVTSLK